jgi:hypothetical protein
MTNPSASACLQASGSDRFVPSSFKLWLDYSKSHRVSSRSPVTVPPSFGNPTFLSPYKPRLPRHDMPLHINTSAQRTCLARGISPVRFPESGQMGRWLIKQLGIQPWTNVCAMEADSHECLAEVHALLSSPSSVNLARGVRGIDAKVLIDFLDRVRRSRTRNSSEHLSAGYSF